MRNAVLSGVWTPDKTALPMTCATRKGPAVVAAFGHRFSHVQMLSVLAIGAAACTAPCASGWANHLPVRSAI
jgi:hypothetical protein